VLEIKIYAVQRVKESKKDKEERTYSRIVSLWCNKDGLDKQFASMFTFLF
jgi:hypothetical protein